MSKEVLYPKRQRCKACGKGFPERGAIMGLYDSYRCAGMAEPTKKPEDAPKWCTTDRGGSLQFKKRLRHGGEVPKALRDDPSASTYFCSHCGFLHIGHQRVKLEVESTRQVTSVSELAEVLLKYRESKGWDRKTAAARAKIRPIRLKELEEGHPDASWDSFFAVVRAYGLKIAMVFK